MSGDKQTIGEILKQTREEQELSLDEIAVLTKVRLKYLTAIESDQYEVLPSKVQIKGFIRSYARALNLDPAPLLNSLRSTLGAEEISDPKTALPEQDQDDLPPQLLDEIGSSLKSQREKLGLSLEEVENQSYIPERYLQAIENGSLEELPSTVQGKGMLKNYAQFLGLDPEPLLLSYADVLQKRLSETRQKDPEPKTPSTLQASIRRFFASPTILWVGVMLLIGLVTIWSGWLVFGSQGQDLESTSTIPGVADILLPTSTFTVTPINQETSPAEIELDITATPEIEDNQEDDLEATPTQVFTGNEKVQVQLVIVQRSWVRVTVDNAVAFEGRLLPGSVQLFGGELNIEVLTGNAGGVEVIYNQRDLGAMGLYGEVISRVYTAEGIVTPTPTITLTPLPSETPTATPEPAATNTPES
jgi:cytoskeletal protein RodZ